jgi:hypothetical protein
MRPQVLFGQGFVKSSQPIVINQNPFQRSAAPKIDEKQKKRMQDVRIKGGRSKK